MLSAPSSLESGQKPARKTNAPQKSKRQHGACRAAGMSAKTKPHDEMPSGPPSRRTIACPKQIRRCATPRRSGTMPAHSSASPRPNSSATASRRRSRPCPVGTPSSSSAARHTTQRTKRAWRRRSSAISTHSWAYCATHRPPLARSDPNAPRCRHAWPRLRNAWQKSRRT